MKLRKYAANEKIKNVPITRDITLENLLTTDGLTLNKVKNIKLLKPAAINPEADVSIERRSSKSIQALMIAGKRKPLLVKMRSLLLAEINIAPMINTEAMTIYTFVIDHKNQGCNDETNAMNNPKIYSRVANVCLRIVKMLRRLMDNMWVKLKFINVFVYE